MIRIGDKLTNKKNDETFTVNEIVDDRVKGHLSDGEFIQEVEWSLKDVQKNYPVNQEQVSEAVLLIDEPNTQPVILEEEIPNKRKKK